MSQASSLSHNNLDALVWLDTSAEQHALFLQAFELARLRVEACLQNPPPEAKGKQLCVFSDCDETLLDNSDFNAGLVRRGEVFEETGNWAEHCRSGRTLATPGALEFAGFLRERGVALFFVTSRREDVREPTATVLSRLGFAVVASGAAHGTDPARTNLFLKGMRINGKETGKFEQYAYVERERGYYPIVWLGDNLSDFDAKFKTKVHYEQGLKGLPNIVMDKSSEQRLDAAKELAEKWGRRWIVMPNPVYGDFMQSLCGSPRALPSVQIADRAQPAMNAQTTPKLHVLTDLQRGSVV